MALSTLIKVGFGVMAAVLYALAGYLMLKGATGTVGYRPGEGIEYVITLCGAAITGFVAAQLGVAVGADSDDGNGGQVGLIERLDRDPDSDGKGTAAVLVIDVLVLVAIGVFFVWLYLDPTNIAVKEGADKLASAPDYISLQAKAFIALVVAGAGGVGIAATK